MLVSTIEYVDADQLSVGNLMTICDKLVDHCHYRNVFLMVR